MVTPTPAPIAEVASQRPRVVHGTIEWTQALTPRPEQMLRRGWFVRGKNHDPFAQLSHDAAWLSNHDDQCYEQLSIQFITADFQNLTASVIYENMPSGASEDIASAFNLKVTLTKRGIDLRHVHSAVSDLAAMSVTVAMGVDASKFPLPYA